MPYIVMTIVVNVVVVAVTTALSIIETEAGREEDELTLIYIILRTLFNLVSPLLMLMTLCFDIDHFFTNICTNFCV